jgi:hypothetical protein
MFEHRETEETVKFHQNGILDMPFFTWSRLLPYRCKNGHAKNGSKLKMKNEIPAHTNGNSHNSIQRNA